MPCESAALSPSCSGTWMHVAQARRRGWCAVGLVGGGAGARRGWCAVGLVRGGACGRPGRRYSERLLGGTAGASRPTRAQAAAAQLPSPEGRRVLPTNRCGDESRF